MERDSTNSLEQGMKHQSIAIDGPAGAGKSTLARALARELGFLYVDTGAIYRTVALKVLRTGGDPASPEQVVPVLAALDIRLEHGPDGEQRMYLDGEDVSRAIREHRVSGAASQVAAIPQVRAFLLDFQRRQAEEHDIVMDGRDIGTVVLPDAQVKIYLTASAEERTRRRMAEYEAKGLHADFEELLREVNLRDEQDRNRAVAPLRKAEDAVELDSTCMNAEEVLAAIETIVKERNA